VQELAKKLTLMHLMQPTCIAATASSRAKIHKLECILSFVVISKTRAGKQAFA
jgi:hypothetical protein